MNRLVMIRHRMLVTFQLEVLCNMHDLSQGSAICGYKRDKREGDSTVTLRYQLFVRVKLVTYLGEIPISDVFTI